MPSNEHSQKQQSMMIHINNQKIEPTPLNQIHM